jgi:hypothetical protein
MRSFKQLRSGIQLRNVLLTSIAALGVLQLLSIGCDSSASGSGGGFGKAFTYGDGGAYQGTSSVVAAATNASAVTSTSIAVTVGPGATTGAGCNDGGPGEPNDTMGQAYNLGEISDNDGDGSQVQGTMASATDVDWYKYHGVDLFGNVVDPTRQVMSAGVRICKYIECDNGESDDFTCPSNTTADMQSGLPGCCWSDSTPVTLDLTCGSTDLDSDNATVFIRVDNPQKLVCQPYVVQYHY